MQIYPIPFNEVFFFFFFVGNLFWVSRDVLSTLVLVLVVTENKDKKVQNLISVLHKQSVTCLLCIIKDVHSVNQKQGSSAN